MDDDGPYTSVSEHISRIKTILRNIEYHNCRFQSNESLQIEQKIVIEKMNEESEQLFIEFKKNKKSFTVLQDPTLKKMEIIDDDLYLKNEEAQLHLEKFLRENNTNAFYELAGLLMRYNKFPKKISPPRYKTDNHVFYL